jgi:hypothetical protein
LNETKPGKVAVIAVHGVAYHAPGASADAVSELVLGLSERDIEAKYAPFEAETVHIPLKPFSVTSLTQPPGDGLFNRFLDRFRERTVYLTRSWRTSDQLDSLPSQEPEEKPGERKSFVGANGELYEKGIREGVGKQSPGIFRNVRAYLAGRRASAQEKSRDPYGKAGIDFMRLLLQNYRGSRGADNKPKDQRDATAYITTRLEGKRTWKDATGADQTMPVHFYEMYWADLSRPNQSVLSFFQALYQLLFHLASLSRLVISTAYENRNDWMWRALDWSQGWAVRMLGLPIPILSALLLISLFGALPHSITDTRVPSAAIYGSAFLGLLIYIVLERKLPATKRPWTWILFPLLFILSFAAIAATLFRYPPEFLRRILAFQGLLLGSAMLYLSVDSYDEVRDGAWETALGLWIPWIFLFIGLFWAFPGERVDQITVWVVQIVLAALRISWLLLFFFALAAFVLGEACWRKIRWEEKKGGDANRYARAKAAVRTSRLALALPTMAVLIVTLILFSIIFVQATSHSVSGALFGSTIDGPLSPSGHRVSGRFLSLLILDREGACNILDEHNCPPTISPSDYFKSFLVWSATPAFPIILALLAYGLLLMTFWVIPSIYTETNPPRRSDNRSSERMGNWISRGLDASKYSTLIMWAAAFAVPALVVALTSLSPTGKPRDGIVRVVHQFHPQPFHNAYHLHDLYQSIGDLSTHLDIVTRSILIGIGAVAGSVAILASFAKSGSSVLGIILDVDNYLRAAPKDATPRAQIMERYVSLLRYLSEYRDPEDGTGYDRVVIVAHSLGALISVDLLHFLKVQDHAPQVPVRLFTMGNPARQLLNRFFPYLYQWIHPRPDNSVRPLENSGAALPKIDSDELPDPAALGVDLWVSAYRSGDYVGRSIWLDEWYKREDPSKPGPFYLATEQPRGRREEMCIGAGAHQHYWDQSAPDIAEKLDRLISS